MKILLISFLLFPAKIFGDYIIHEKIHEAAHNLPCTIEAFVDILEEDIHSFSLLYRPMGNLEYLETPMMIMGQLKYMAVIPENFMVRDHSEYYLLLELSNGKKVTFPQKDAIHNPITIQIDLPTEKNIPITSSEIKNFDIVGLSPDIMIISPQPGERVRIRDLFIALAYFKEKNIDPTKVRVYLDGLDVSNSADIDSTYLSISSKSITPGIHTVTVNITNKFNQKFDDISWSFSVLPNDATEAGLIRTQSGNIWANYNGGSVDNSIMNIGEFNVLYEVDLDFLQCAAQYTKSSLENEYNQPRDRYALYLNNKLMNIKLGDSYPSIDQYALNGHHVRGVNFSFNYGPFLVDIIKGNTARAVQGHPSNGAITITDIDSTISLSRNNYTFQQGLLGGKIGIKLGNRFYWDMNYIRVQDYVATVSRELDDAIITIPTQYDSTINSDYIDDYFYVTDEIYSIRYDSLMNNDNYKILFAKVDSIAFSTKNWIGTKPRDNLIYGSNIKLGFDNSRVQVSTGFSVSFLNRNRWNNLQSISELDTIAVDESVDGYFLNYLQLDNTGNWTQYEKYFSLGTNQQPMVPFLLQKEGAGIINILSMSNLNRYIKLQLRYIGHRVELASKRNGPDYYSILNPYLKTNYSEIYFSDRLHLFKNKLLLYYKRSKIIEGIYSEQISPIEKRKSLFNISLFPGTSLPTLNFGFSSSHRSNNENRIIDYITYFKPNSPEPDTITFIRKEDTINNLFNISMTNQFQFWGKQMLSVNILLFDLTDKVAEKVNLDTLKFIGYMPKDAASESYGISLKSVYNSYWESTVYLNTSNYDYGRKGFDYNNDGKYDSIDDYRIQNLRHLQLNLVYHPTRYVTKLNFGLHHTYSWGSDSITKYNFQIGAESELLENLIISLNFDYRIKLMDTENKGRSESFIRAYLNYNIL